MKYVAIDHSYIPEETLESISNIDGITSAEVFHDTPENQEETFRRAKDAEIVSGTVNINYDAALLSKLPRLKAIIQASVGVNNIDLDAARQKGIRVYNSAGYNSNAVAEMALGLSLALMRNIHPAVEHLRSGGTEYSIFEGRELTGKKVSILGAGNIGSRIAELFNALNCDVTMFTKHPSVERAKSLGIVGFASLEECLNTADIVIVALPLTAETEGMLGDEQLALMKSTSFLINVGRQKVIDEMALAEKLLEGNIAGFAGDIFYEDPFEIDKVSDILAQFARQDNVILTPHIAAETVEANQELVTVFKANFERFISGDDTNRVV